MIVVLVNQFRNWTTCLGLHTKNNQGSIKETIVYWFGPYCIVEQSSLIPYPLRSKNCEKVTFAVHTNRMKPYVHPALTPIKDDPSKPYLDE